MAPCTRLLDVLRLCISVRETFWSVACKMLLDSKLESRNCDLERLLR